MSVCTVVNTCGIDGCDMPTATRGWCRKHYTRWQRHGDPLATRVPMRGDAEARFFAKVLLGPVAVNNPELGHCWDWIAYISPGGYGKFGVGRTPILAHVWSYEHFVADIPKGLELDHFACDRRRCVNPWHVRPVTRQENTLRGNCPAAWQAAQTECIHGHPFDEDNTYWWGGRRYCRRCHVIRQTERNRRLRAERRNA